MLDWPTTTVTKELASQTADKMRSKSACVLKLKKMFILLLRLARNSGPHCLVTEHHDNRDGVFAFLTIADCKLIGRRIQSVGASHAAVFSPFATKSNAFRSHSEVVSLERRMASTVWVPRARPAQAEACGYGESGGKGDDDGR